MRAEQALKYSERRFSPLVSYGKITWPFFFLISTWSDDILICVATNFLILGFRNLAILSSCAHASTDMNMRSSLCRLTNRNVPLLAK